MKQDVDNMIVINNLLKMNINYVEMFSSNVFVSLNLAFSKLVDKSVGKSKRENGIEKFTKCIEKIKKIEVKRIDNELFSLIKHNNINYVSSYNFKLKNKVLSKIKDFKLYSEFLDFYLSLYVKEINKKNIKIKTKNEEISNKEVVIELPVLKKDSFLIIDGYMYSNLMYDSDNNLIIDFEAFSREKDKYNKYISMDKKKLFLEPLNGTLSVSEKKRRIYLQSMFELDKKFNKLNNMEVNSSYNIELLFEYIKLIIDNLYKDLLRNISTKNVYDMLYNLTIEEYSIENKLSNVEIFINELSWKISKLNNEDYSGIKRDIDKYGIMFIDSNNLLPNLEDIYYILNKKIIKNINNYYNDYSSNKLLLERVTKYMDINSLVIFYNELKNILIRNNKLSNSKYLNLRDNIVNIIINKNKLDRDTIIKEILKEEL